LTDVVATAVAAVVAAAAAVVAGMADVSVGAAAAVVAAVARLPFEIAAATVATNHAAVAHWTWRQHYRWHLTDSESAFASPRVRCCPRCNPV